MQQYIFRRLLQAIPLLFGITLVSFIIIHMAPGDPATSLIDPNTSPDDMLRLKHQLGLDRPIYVQYWIWLTHLLQGNFGHSFVDGRPVLVKIWERVPTTVMLMGLALLLRLLIAIPVGVMAAIKQYTKFDYTATVLAFGGLAIPEFWFGLMMILLFGVKLRWFPFLGLYTYGNGSFLDRVDHLVLPLAVLGLHGSAGLTRYMRSSMLEVIRQDFVRTARAKGLAERIVIYKHGLKNAMIPIVTILGLDLPVLFGGALIIENLYSIPGMGRLAVESVFRRDYPVIMGVNLIAAALVVLGNLLADILYAVVDPRVKYS